MITLCTNCHEPIWDKPKFGWRHLTHNPFGRVYCDQSASRATYGLQAWESEDPTLTIVGTHERALGLKVATRLYTDLNGELPDDLPTALENARVVWFNTKHPNYEDERWPDGIVSDTERDGDTPALMYGW